MDAEALLDTGSTGSCMHRDFVRRHRLETHMFDVPIEVYNADGTVNSGGRITHYVDLLIQIGDHRERMSFLVTDLGKSDIFLGYEWVTHHNPKIDWRAKHIEFARCPDSCERVLDEGERLFALQVGAYCAARSEHIRATQLRAKATDIAIEQNRRRETPRFEEAVPPAYHDFAEVFAEETFAELPERRPYDHAIELLPGAQPYCGKVYPMTLDQQRALDEFLEENLRTGRIRPSKSPWGAPFFFVKKKDGSLRPVQDYRKLNAVTKKNKYPLPLISELLDKLKGAKYYTKMDIRWGYNNVRMREGDEEKAAFLTNRGLFEPLVMFFGLSNSPATFQMMMNDVFRDLILRGKVIVYLDDILIFTESIEEHREIVRQVLDILRQNKLTCKLEKCEFETLETEYLGHIISQGVVKMDPAKVAGVVEWPVPTCKKELQSFLGFANFYRRFIAGFAKVAAPLHRLTGSAEWTWGPDQEEAFARLKSTITAAPVLAIPNDNDQFRVQCDASNYAVGAELSQRQHGKWRTIAYLSKALSPAERNYEIYDREMLAVMTALNEWRHFLMGARQTFEIHSDHKNLEYFRQPQKLNARQARWVVTLQDYDFTLTHKPGAAMGRADALSRRADHAGGTEVSDKTILLKTEWFRAQIDGTDLLLAGIREHGHELDNSVRSRLAAKDPEYWTVDGLTYRRGRIVVPANKALRGRLIMAHHDSVAAGHPGRAKTQELIYRSYWWPSIKRDVQTYVRTCPTCQRTKIDHLPRAAPLNPNPVPDYNWQYISVDMITHLPNAQGQNAVLMMVDMKSKDFIPVATTDELNSEGWANLLIRHVVSVHGIPERIYSDRGSIFISNLIRDLYRKLGIRGNPSTAYHPQTDGQTERMNQELENYLRIFTSYRQEDWPDWLPMAAFSYRIREHSATGYSPFYMTHGREPYTGVETRKEVKTEAAEQFASRMKQIQEEAGAALTIAKDVMKRNYDRHKRAARVYEEGAWVYLDAYNITTDRPSKKLDDKRYGPFQIERKVGAGAYRLKLPKTWRSIHPVFNEALLWPAHEPEFPNQVSDRPIPNLTTSAEEPEEILDSRVKRGRLTYLVRWKGKPLYEATWEHRSDLLKSCKNLLDAFHAENPQAPRMPTIRIPQRSLPEPSR